MTSARAGATEDSPSLNPVLLAISLGLHLFGFGLAVGIPRLLANGGGARPVYVVDLVAAAPGPPAAAPAPARGAPAPKKAASPAPKPEKPIKLPVPGIKPKEKKKPPETKKVETPPAPAEDRKPADAKSSAAAKGTAETKPGAETGAATGAAGTTPGPGGAGGTGSGQADAITFYAGLLKRRIEGSWLRPLYPQGWSGSTDPTASVRIVLTGSGRVTGLEVVVPSGYEAMDRSILRAVQDAQPFPPFPSELGRDQLSVKIDFVLPPPGQ